MFCNLLLVPVEGLYTKQCTEAQTLHSTSALLPPTNLAFLTLYEHSIHVNSIRQDTRIFKTSRFHFWVEVHRLLPSVAIWWHWVTKFLWPTMCNPPQSGYGSYLIEMMVMIPCTLELPVGVPLTAQTVSVVCWEITVRPAKLSGYRTSLLL